MISNISPVLVDRPIGIWTRKSSAEHFERLGKLLTLQRNIFGRGCLLVDLDGAVVQLRDSFDYVQSDFDGILRRSDKVAFVGGGLLVRVQKRRLRLSADMRMFDDADAARRWMLDG